MSSSAITSLIQNNVDLSAFNTLALPSFAKYYFDLKEINQLRELGYWLHESDRLSSVFILGGGSNVVLPQQLNRFVIHNQLKGISLVDEDDDYYYVRAAAGEVWHDFVSFCLDSGWYGLENLALIPGTVGAAPVQNIGAYGRELKDFCYEVEAYDFESQSFKTFNNEDCEFAYRDSYFKREGRDLVIVSVTFRLAKAWTPEISYPDLQGVVELIESGDLADIKPQHVFERVCEVRRAKLPDPAQLGNAGSFFKNPIVSAEQQAGLISRYPAMPSYPQPSGDYKLAAAWLIDQCGWKGRTFDAVGVHERQALVLVNLGGATADDIYALSRAIQVEVEANFDVSLEPEPSFIN